ncbi:ABC transporter permease [Aneurinibacillus sp. Ricciae_BoGa-3]|uniref:ABC transporter permease n=1 Tax=Aneurinibacillus sp. Ricciae_BoGa-3 TaxID=3022697 RepID=UPI002341102F|nr:ABC transporter permease [Aneurinibacillus sp. Ricciae_BoGa-3]WCK53476.1 ABC transporter permease [Aneurinibacillus sp. Ricciae_BoGa-3]
MLSYIIRRLLQLIPVLIGMSIVVFCIIHAIPGDPAQVILGEHATPKTLADLRQQLHLNDPLYKQYFYYIRNILTGDLGESLRTKRSITDEIGPYLAATLELSITGLIFAVIVGVNAGIIAAWKRNSWFDYVAMLVALVGVSMPVFWLGLMEQLVFAQKLDWLPSIGRFNTREPITAITNFYLLDTIIKGDWNGFKDVLRHLILPGIALGTIPMAIIARMTRSSMLEVMKSDFIRTARAKGLHEFWVVYRHALKNAFIPVLTVIGLQLGLLLGGAVLTETIFGWPGIGRYINDAIAFRDYPVVQSGILVIAFLFVLINLIVDILYAYIDPRIQYK